MIDNFAIAFFGFLIVYTAYKASMLDKELPWFSLERKKVKKTRENKINKDKRNRK